MSNNVNENPSDQLKEKETIKLVSESESHHVLDDKKLPGVNNPTNPEGPTTPVLNMSASGQKDDPNQLTPWKRHRQNSALSTRKNRKFLLLVIAIFIVAPLLAVVAAIFTFPLGPQLLETQIGCAIGNHAMMLDGFKRGWNDDPKYVGVIIGLANQRSAVDRNAATELYNDCVRINPNCANCYMNRGVNYASLGEYDKALADYNKAIKLNPEYALAYNNRGCLFMSMRELDKALADANRAVKFAPQRADFYFNRGLAYEQLNERGKASSDFERAEQLAPPSDGRLKQAARSHLFR